jgi:hypothetical protein
MGRLRRKPVTLSQRADSLERLSSFFMTVAGISVGSFVLLSVGMFAGWVAVFSAGVVASWVARALLLVGLVAFAWVLTGPLQPPAWMNRRHDWLAEEWLNDLP